MVNVCLVSNLGINNPSSLQWHLIMAARRLGWEISNINAQDSAFKQIKEQKIHLPDFFIFIEGDFTTEYPSLDLSSVPIPKVMWCLDSYIIASAQKDWAKKIRADYVFVCQKDWSLDFKRHGFPNAMWLPVCGDQLFHRPIETEIKYDITSVSGMNIVMSRVRYDTANYLAENGISIDVHTQDTLPEDCKFNYTRHRPMLDEYSEIVCSGKMLLNVPNRFDTTMRIFEGQLMGRPVLTASSSGIDELFENEKDGIILFKDKEEAVEKAKHYRDNFDECLKIAQRGMEKCLRYHMYEMRLKQMWDIIRGIKPDMYWEM